MSLGLPRVLWTAFGLWSCFLSPRALEAQALNDLVAELTLESFLLADTPVVRSYARAVLYDAQGGRIYDEVTSIGV